MRPLPPDGSGHPAGIGGLLTNPSLMSALLSCLAAQLLKPLAHQYLHPEKRLDWKWAVSPGGSESRSLQQQFGSACTCLLSMVYSARNVHLRSWVQVSVYARDTHA